MFKQRVQSQPERKCELQHVALTVEQRLLQASAHPPFQKNPHRNKNGPTHSCYRDPSPNTDHKSRGLGLGPRPDPAYLFAASNRVCLKDFAIIDRKAWITFWNSALEILFGARLSASIASLLSFSLFLCEKKETEFSFIELR